MNYDVDSVDDGFTATFHRLLVGWDADITTDTSGVFFFNSDRAELSLSDPVHADYETGAEISWLSGVESFSIRIDRILLVHGGETRTDTNGVLYFDKDRTNMRLSDLQHADFEAELSASWLTSDDISEWAFNMDRALVWIGSEMVLDSAASMKSQKINLANGFNGDPFFDIEISSTPTANMRLGMGMNIIWYEQDEILVMAMDHFDLAWKGNANFIATGSFIEDDAGRPTGRKRQTGNGDIPVSALIAVGVVLFIIVLSVVVFVVIRKRKKSSSGSSLPPSPANNDPGDDDYSC